MTDVGRLIDEIEKLPHFRAIRCQRCSEELRVHALQIYCKCPKCGAELKCRSFGAAGTEVEDLVDAVLQWAGDGETFEAVMRRRREILSDRQD